MFWNSVFAEKAPIILKNNITQLIDLSKTTRSTKLYKSWELGLRIDSEWWVTITQRQNTLIIWVPAGTQTGTGNLVLSYKEKEFLFPIEIDIPEQSDTDFNIRNSLFQKNLQQRALSCESSATSDILSTLLGENITENTVVSLLPKSTYYNKLPEKTSDWIIWGNPREGFVWYIDDTSGVNAKQATMTGYGVYEYPITQVYQYYWLKTEILNKQAHYYEFTPNNHLSYLLEHLQKWNMVQLWGDWCTDFFYEDGTISSEKITNSLAQNGVSGKNECYNVAEPRTLSWKYYNAQWVLTYHEGLDGQHAFVLLGWKGDIQNPSHIRVWDTNTGYHEYDLKEWMRKWKAMDYRSVVIYKK